MKRTTKLNYIYIRFLYDVTLKQYFILFSFIVIYSFLFIFNFLFSFGFGFSKVYYNNEYLWLKFRKEASTDPDIWVDSSDSKQVLERFSDQFLRADLTLVEVEQEVASKDEDEKIDVFKSLAKFRTKQKQWRNYRQMLKSDLGQLKKKMSQKKRKNFLKVQLKRFMLELAEKRFNIINDLRKQTGALELNNDFYKDFEKSLDFNYNRFFLDSEYSSYYQLRRDDYSKLSLFLARGYSRDLHIKQLVFQDSDLEFFPLDLANQEDNEEFLVFSNIVNNFFLTFDKFFVLPRWVLIKDTSTSNVVRSKKEILGQDIFIADVDPWICEGGFIYFFLLPIFLLFNFVRFRYGLLRWPFVEKHPQYLDIFIYIKILFINNSFFLTKLSCYLGLNSWMAELISKYIPTAGFSKYWRASYKWYFLWKDMDPFFSYNNIFKHNHTFIGIVAEKEEIITRWHRKYYWDWSFLYNIFFNIIIKCKEFFFINYSFFIFFLIQGIYCLILLCIHFIGLILRLFAYFFKKGKDSKQLININMDVLVYLRRFYSITRIKWNYYFKNKWF